MSPGGSILALPLDITCGTPMPMSGYRQPHAYGRRRGYISRLYLAHLQSEGNQVTSSQSGENYSNRYA